MNHNIYEAQDLRLRIYKKKVKRSGWILPLIILFLAIVIIAGWEIWVELESNKIISEYPQGGWVRVPHLDQDTKEWLTLNANQELL